MPVSPFVHRVLAARLLAAVVAAGSILGCAVPRPAADLLAAAGPIGGRMVPATGDATADRIPDVNMSGALLYQLMAAEVAAQRGELGTAYAVYLKLARETRDPRLARRATELALQGRALGQGLEGAQLWHELAPGSAEAGQTLAMLQAASGRFEDAYTLFSAQLKAAPQPADELLRIQRALTRSQDRAGAFALLERLARPYAASADVRLALADGAHAAGLPGRAAEEARAAVGLAPDSERAALAAARYLQPADRPAAAAILSAYLDRNPKATEVRLAYARLLIADRRYEAARGQFERLVSEDPANPDLVYSLALLSMQGSLRSEARGYLQRYLKLLEQPGNEDRDADRAYLHLAQIAEEEKQYGEALQWLRKVEGGDEYVPARVREAFVLARQQKLDEARRLLQQARAQSDEERVQLIVAEGQLLRDAGRHAENYALLQQALEKNPDNLALLYDAGMAAERTDRLPEMEKHLRRMIELKPDYAHAYNALGYSLADRNLRLAEALELIEKAHALAPEDPYILDSLGWVHYRLGDLVRAREYLQKAYDAKPEAEVAIHLAEVLWKAGARDRALELLREVRAKEPANELLKSTLGRLGVGL